MIEGKQKFTDAFSKLYGSEKAEALSARLWERLVQFKKEYPGETTVKPDHRVSESDVIMIAYGDMVQKKEKKPLDVLHHFSSKYLNGFISTIHILPFFPFSSDDGFSVIDYKKVKPEWGDWGHVDKIGKDFGLMFDVVVNHISQHSDWFQAFLLQKEPFCDYFITVDPAVDLSAVFRPRALPLLTEVQTTAGMKHVWTTFSADQIDLNFSNPEVLFEVLDVFLFYIAHGVKFIRLDAVAFIWKEIGTNCLHLHQVHQIIELTRSVLDEVAPQVVLITETNVPHQENISYFGDGHGEAQMVYNFSLPPLVLHSIQTANATRLKEWAKTLDLPSEEVTFFNFLASHDGVGLLPARGILSDGEIDALAEHTLLMGGRVSYKNNPDGSRSPYEMNINYLDATRPGPEMESVELTARRFLATQSILLMLRGVPGIYYHSLLGSQNWIEGMLENGQNRTINREKLMIDELESDLHNIGSLRHQVFEGYKKLLKVRREETAFDPHGIQEIINTPPSVFGIYRCAREEELGIYCFTNLADVDQTIRVSPGDIRDGDHAIFRDLMGYDRYESIMGELSLVLSPYQTVWLKEL